jgi:hypothetical protein
MNVGRPLTRIAGALIQPTAAPTRRAAMLASIAIVWGSAWLPGWPVVLRFGLLLGLAVIVYQVIRDIVRSVIASRYQRVLEPQPRGMIGLPLLVAVGLALSGAAWWVVFLVQRPYLDRWAQWAWAEVPALEAPSGSRFVGLYWANVHVTPHEVILFLPGDVVLWYNEEASRKHEKHLCGPWFYHGWRYLLRPSDRYR